MQVELLLPTNRQTQVESVFMLAMVLSAYFGDFMSAQITTFG